MKNLFKALADFQQECPTIHKTTQGYGYSYSDLPTIFGVINPLLKKHGLGFTQMLNRDELVTTLFHCETGEKIESTTLIPQNVKLKGMNDFQVLGSAVTYLRRYALSSMLGVVTDKDIDAKGEQEGEALSNERFSKAIELFNEEKLTKEQLTEKLKPFNLTESQKKTLQIVKSDLI
jgi:hypothetical protein